MHTDDHILEACIAADKPLPAIAATLGITLIALVKWMDRNADLLAMAKRAMAAHVAFLSLHAEAAAIADLSAVSSTTTNEERKRKSSSQLLRHFAKRLVTPPRRSREEIAEADDERPSCIEPATTQMPRSALDSASLPHETRHARTPAVQRNRVTRQFPHAIGSSKQDRSIAEPCAP